MLRSLSYRSLGELQQDEMPLRKGDQAGAVEIPSKAAQSGKAKRPRLKRRASLGKFFRRTNSVPKKLGAERKDESADDLDAWSTQSWGNAFSDSESKSKQTRSAATNKSRRRLKSERAETPADDNSSSSSSSDCSSNSDSSDSQSESSRESDRRASPEVIKSRQSDNFFPPPKRFDSNKIKKQSPEDSSNSYESSDGSVTSSGSEPSEGSDTRQHKQVLRGNMVPSKAFASEITSPIPKGRMQIPNVAQKSAISKGANNPYVADDDESLVDEDSSIESSMGSIPPPVMAENSKDLTVTVEDLNQSLHDIQTDKEEMTKMIEELDVSTRALESQLRETKLKKTRRGKACTSKEEEAQLAAELQAMLDEKRDMADIIATLEKESREIESKIRQTKSSDGPRQTNGGSQRGIVRTNSGKSMSPVPPELQAMKDEKQRMADMIAKLQQETLEMENRLKTVQMKNKEKTAVREPQQSPDAYDLHSDEESMTEIQPDDCNKSLSSFPSMHDLRQSMSLLADDILPISGGNGTRSPVNGDDVDNDDSSDDDDNDSDDDSNDSSDEDDEDSIDGSTDDDLEDSETDEEEATASQAPPTGMGNGPTRRAFGDPPSGDEDFIDPSELSHSNGRNEARHGGEASEIRVNPRRTKPTEGLETTAGQQLIRCSRVQS